MGESDWARRQASVQVNGAKRLRLSRWERGTYERVARGRAQLEVSAGGRPQGSDDPGGCAKAGVFFDVYGIYWNQER